MSGSLCSRGNWCLQYIVTQQNSYPGNRTHGIRLMQQMFTECLLHARLCSGYFISMRKQTKISSLLEFCIKNKQYGAASLLRNLCLSPLQKDEVGLHKLRLCSCGPPLPAWPCGIMASSTDTGRRAIGLFLPGCPAEGARSHG